VAAQAALELLAEGAPGAEDEGLDGAEGHVEHVCDLGIRASFELAHDQGGALVEGEEAERAADLGGGGNVGALGRGCWEGVVERAVGGGAAARERRNHPCVDAVRAAFLRFTPGHCLRRASPHSRCGGGRLVSFCSLFVQRSNPLLNMLEAGGGWSSSSPPRVGMWGLAP